MHILFITDQNYLAPTVVSMTSVCENNKEYDIVFHVLFDVSRPLNGLQLLQDVAERYGKQCVFHKFDFSRYERLLPFGRSEMPSHCSIATYYRLFVADILPTDIDKVLYLDGDVLVRGSLAGLFEGADNHVAIEGAVDNWEGDVSKFNRLRYNPSFRYINAGVLMLHLDYWRREHVQDLFLDYIANHSDRIVHHDQDVINACLFDKKKILPFRYNVQDGYLFESPNFCFYDREKEFNSDIRNPIIIHYCSSSKPWQKECKHPYANEYLKYMSICGLLYSDFPKKKMSVKEIIRSALVSLGVFRENVYYAKDLRINQP